MKKVIDVSTCPYCGHTKFYDTGTTKYNAGSCDEHLYECTKCNKVCWDNAYIDLVQLVSSSLKNKKPTEYRICIYCNACVTKDQWHKGLCSKCYATYQEMESIMGGTG